MTLQYVIDDGGAVMCPSAINITFYIKLTIHIDVKYHVNIYFLVFRSNFSFPHLIRCNTVKFFKCYRDVCHFLCNCLSPKFSPRLPFNFVHLIYSLGDTYTKLV